MVRRIFLLLILLAVTVILAVTMGGSVLAQGPPAECPDIAIGDVEKACVPCPDNFKSNRAVLVVPPKEAFGCIVLPPGG